jgi:hypothetical protein
MSSESKIPHGKPSSQLRIADTIINDPYDGMMARRTSRWEITKVLVLQRPTRAKRKLSSQTLTLGGRLKVQIGLCLI